MGWFSRSAATETTSAKEAPKQSGGTVEALGPVDVSDLAKWLSAIPQDEWPKMSDAAWHGANERCRPLAESLLVAHFPGCSIAGTGLFLLEPGQEHPTHTDVQAANWVTRVHVPIVTNKDATVTTDEGTFHMAKGKAYRFDTMRNHAVKNGGKEPRVHLVFDVRR